MRRIRYSVAMSLDGYIAGPKGEFDWIKTDPDFDFSAVFKQFDTILAGRGTFEPMAAAGRTSMPGMKTIVGGVQLSCRWSCASRPSCVLRHQRTSCPSDALRPALRVEDRS